MKIKLGKKYRDTISGFEGVATGRFEYLHGCVRYQLEAGAKDDGGLQELIFDEQRLEAVDPPRTITPRATSGGPRPKPRRA
jgi:hypothetical protein